MPAEKSHDKDVVETYLDGFRRTDHAQILSCLTDDVVWTVFGAFRLEGKEAYDAAIEGPGFAGHGRALRDARRTDLRASCVCDAAA